MIIRRNVSYRRHWKNLIKVYGSLCYYCKDEIATTIDHVIPYSHDQDNSINNLVPACSLCNLIAGSKHFEYVEEKRQYILSHRKRKKKTRSICPDCLLPFGYLIHSPSVVLCAECYDLEYGTNYSDKKVWQDWLKILYTAGIAPKAHENIRGTSFRYIHDRKHALVAEYESVLENDKDFCPWISFSQANSISEESK